METQNNEIEVMRQQLASLNRKLEGQAIVNDHLMRETMKGKMSWIKTFIWAEIIAVPILIALFLCLALAFDLSLGPVILMAAILVASVASDYKINKIGDNTLFEGNIMETATKLLKMKKQRIIDEIVFVPILAIWFVWAFFDLYKHIPGDGVWRHSLYGCFVGGIIGCVIGVVAAVLIVRKMQRTNDAIIKQINELTA